ncbi:arginase [Carabus blaptoides fortunei]
MLLRVVRGVCSVFNSHRFYHKVGVIGVPFNKGQRKDGVQMGPSVIRESGLLTEFKELYPNIDIKDYGDVKYEIEQEIEVPNMRNWTHVAKCNEELSKHVYNIIQAQRVCLTLGGDHSIGLGTVHGHAKACEPGKLAVLWIDAHADINTSRTSGTGNLHGMPVALLATEMEDQWPSLPFLEWHTPLLSLNKIAYIGLRSVDLCEREVIEKFAVSAYDTKDIEQHGIHGIITAALAKIDPDNNCSLHISFDIDSLDVLEAPSTGTPVRGGLTLREGMEIVENISATGRLQAIDLVEYAVRVFLAWI